MKILLDTHIWLWLVLQPHKLGMRLRREIESPRNDLFLSPVSIWEAQRATARSHRIKLDQPFHLWLEQTMQAAPIQEAPFTFAVAIEAATLVLPKPDPGDLFLAATAIVQGLTLATADEQLIRCRAVKTLANV